MSKIADLEEPLDRALALARAVELMGYGLRNLDDDLVAAVVTVAEALTAELATAKSVWRQLMPKRRA
jgi:hypothetical protein